MSSAISRTIQFEDVLLIVWVAFVEPGLLRVFGDRLTTDSGPGLGVIYLLACALALVSYATRSREDEAGARNGRLTPENYARMVVIGPLFFIGAAALDLLGSQIGETLLLIIPGIILALTLIMYERLPQISRLARRLLMTPMVLIAAAWFARFSSSLFGNLGPGELLEGLRTPSVNFIPILFLFAVCVFYLGFIFAPRQVANSGGSWLQWAVRFGFFIAALLFNVRVGMFF
ncbi:MAG: hypothetical protein J5I90_07905 [Caldilineales bacterium]|nr:hypothetical protein [Caldilineales bacterium]